MYSLGPTIIGRTNRGAMGSSAAVPSADPTMRATKPGSILRGVLCSSRLYCGTRRLILPCTKRGISAMIWKTTYREIQGPRLMIPAASEVQPQDTCLVCAHAAISTNTITQVPTAGADALVKHVRPSIVPYGPADSNGPPAPQKAKNDTR